MDEEVIRRVALSRNGMRFERVRNGEWDDDPSMKSWCRAVNEALRWIADNRSRGDGPALSPWMLESDDKRLVVDPRGYKVRFERLEKNMWVVDQKLNVWGAAATAALRLSSETFTRPLPQPIYVGVVA